MRSSLLYTEWLKLNRYPAFWLLLGICMITYPGINLIGLNIYYDVSAKESTTGQIVTMLIGNPFAFPEVWKTSAYLSSIFIFIPAVLVIMLITNEYNYKTSRQNIIDGWSRTDFMWAKAIDVLLVTLIVTLMFAVVALGMGIYNTNTEEFSIPEQSYYIGLFFLHTFSQLSIAFLTGLLVRKAFLAMAIFVFYAMIAEPIAVGLLKFKFKSELGRFFPLEIADRMLPPPTFMSKLDMENYQLMLDRIPTHIGMTLGLILLTWFINYLVYLKRDL